MGRLVIAAALALLAGPASAGVEVTAKDGHVDVTAAHAPLSDVLDNLARKTRMKVVYEGGTPRNPVTIELRGRTPAEAVLGVLEGLGLNYAIALDLSGTQVEMLMIVGAGGMSSSSPSGSLRPARGRRDVEVEQGDDGTEAEPAVAYEAPPSPEPAKPEEAARPAPAAPPGPLNPVTSPFPGTAGPMVPGPPLVAPSPSPNSPPPNH